MTSARSPRITRREALTLTGIGSAGLLAGGAAHEYRRRHAQPPEFGATVAMQGAEKAASWQSSRRIVEASEADIVHPESRVIRGPYDAPHLRAQEKWLSEISIPSAGASGEIPTDFFSEAALDLWVLTHDLPAPVAGWPQAWRYAWPRDTSHVAVALASLGDRAGARRELRALNTLVGRATVMHARYKPGGGVPDSRPPQDDGWGWVLWALDSCDHAWVGTEEDTSLRALAKHCAERLLARIGDHNLPSPSPDYWEVEAPQLTLGTAAPALIGLERASHLLSRGDDQDSLRLAEECSAKARVMETAIWATFGTHGWPREIKGGESDAAITFMLPPYRPNPSRQPELMQAVSVAASQMLRGNGGYAPGGDWKNDGVAWTPEIALLARAWMNTEETMPRAYETLQWLANHRTSLGSLSEKVWFDGTPAGPAPLAWTAALCLELGSMKNV